MIFLGIVGVWKVADRINSWRIRKKLMKIAIYRGVDWTMSKDIGSGIYHTDWDSAHVIRKYKEAIEKADIARLKKAYERFQK